MQLGFESFAVVWRINLMAKQFLLDVEILFMSYFQQSRSQLAKRTNINIPTITLSIIIMRFSIATFEAQFS